MFFFFNTYHHHHHHHHHHHRYIIDLSIEFHRYHHLQPNLWLPPLRALFPSVIRSWCLELRWKRHRVWRGLHQGGVPAVTAGWCRPPNLGVSNNRIPIASWFISWKIPSRNGWWLGVPPCMETPRWELDDRWRTFGGWEGTLIRLDKDDEES